MINNLNPYCFGWILLGVRISVKLIFGKMKFEKQRLGGKILPHEFAAHHINACGKMGWRQGGFCYF